MNNQTDNLSKKVYNATKWSAVTNILRKLITPIINMILARLLTPDIFGVVATINVVISFADLFTDAGFQKYLIQHEFKDDNELYNCANVAFWTNLTLSIFIWLIISLFRNYISSLVGSAGYGFHLMIAALTIPLLSFSSIQQAIYKRNFNFKGLFIPSMINSIIPLLVTVPLAYFTGSCWSLIIGTLASKISDAIFLTIKSNWKPKLYYNFIQLKDMFSFSMWTMFESLSIWLVLNIDIFILGNLISNYYLGLYKTSLTSVNQITTLITTTIIPVLFSVLSRSQNNDKMFKQTFYSFQRESSILLIPLSIGMFIYSDVVTWILLGNKWMEASHAIGILGLMQAITVIISNFASEVYRAKGQPKISFLTQIIYLFILIPTIILGAKIDFKTLCTLRALSLIMFALIHLLNLKFKYKFELKLMLSNIIEPLTAAIIMGVFGLTFVKIFNTLWLELISIFICVVIYFLSCLLFSKTRNTILTLIKKINIKKIKELQKLTKRINI